MRNSLASTIAVLFLAAAAMAQDGLIIPASVKPQVRTTAKKIYLAACAAVEREFGATRSLDPRVVLVLGGKKDDVVWKQGEIRMRDWDPNLFAQGVIALAYRQLMPLHVTQRKRGRKTGEVNHGFARRDRAASCLA